MPGKKPVAAHNSKGTDSRLVFMTLLVKSAALVLVRSPSRRAIVPRLQDETPYLCWSKQLGRRAENMQFPRVAAVRSQYVSKVARLMLRERIAHGEQMDPHR